MRFAYAVPAIIVLTLLVGSGLFIYIIPRTDLSVRTVYHETPGGGGTGGVINVNVLLKNSGNTDIEDLSIDVKVLNSTGRYMSGQIGRDVAISPGRCAELKINFVGSQYDTYAISIHLRFESRSGTTIANLDHVTREDEMNLVFIDELP